MIGKGKKATTFENSNKPMKLRAVKGTIALPRSITMIQARIQGDPQSGTEGVVEATARQRKARIERSLSIVRDKRVNIAVMNGGEEAIKFSKGEILATFTPWQEGAEIMAIMEVEEKQEEEKQENEEPKALPKWGGTTKDQVEETLREAARQADMPLSKKERAELEETLLKNKEVFVRQLNKAAAATYPPHQINTGDHPPVTQRSYRMPPPMQDFIVEETKKTREDRIGEAIAESVECTSCISQEERWHTSILY